MKTAPTDQNTTQRGTAKVFMNGRSQAVRLPAAFRFTQNEVSVTKDPVTGDLTLSERSAPNPEERRKRLDAIFAELDAAGAADFVLERDMSLPVERDLF